MAVSLRAAVARLPEDQRIAVALVLIEGLRYKDTAEILGISIGTLTSRLARGRAMLQALQAGNGRPS
jgi:RNA polymerase sigma-70 factor (ECF subfamily)